MALTYRNVKGSALTIDELDDNFSYFTGSHAVTGSLVISGSSTITGSLTISGSSTLTNIGPFENDGIAYLNGEVNGATTNHNIVFPQAGFTIDAKFGSVNFQHIGYREDTGFLELRGRANISSSFNQGIRFGTNGGALTPFEYLDGTTQRFTFRSGQGSVTELSYIIEDLPTSEPSVTGSLWISGSSPNHPNSGYLMIFNP